DRTAAIAEERGVAVLKHGKNRGKGAAIFTGLVEAERRGFSSVVTVDADGQHPASSARAVLEGGGDRDLVLGIRDLVRDGAPKMNRMSNGISNFFISYFGGRKLGDTQCGLRRYPVRETLALGAHAHGYAFEAEVLLLAMAHKLPILEVPIAVRYPPEEERVTHFDSVKDPARIVAVVVRTLLSLRSSSAESSVQPDGE
ncbi:MAG: glycosyltransferase family 2 protein, partial [Polyangiaceae bacterium]